MMNDPFYLKERGVQELESELGSELEWELGYLVAGRLAGPAIHPHYCHGRELFPTMLTPHTYTLIRI